jgi:hypothetical protein
MKAKQREQILAQNAALRGEIAQDAASRGTYGGGNMGANLRRAADVTTGELARSGRDIDIAAATQNTADRRAAAALGDQFLTSTLNRGLGAHGARLDTARFNADEGRFAHGSEVDRANFALNRALSQAGLDQGNLDAALQAWQIGTQRDLGNRGLDLDERRLEEQAKQFAKAHGLDWVRVLNDMVMGRADYGARLAQIQQLGQNSLIDWIFGGRGV